MFVTEQLEKGEKINKRKDKEDGGKGAKRRIMSLVLQVCCVKFIFPQTLSSLLGWSTFLVDNIKYSYCFNLGRAEIKFGYAEEKKNNNQRQDAAKVKNVYQIKENLQRE